MTRANYVLAHREIQPKRLGRILSVDPRSRRVAWAYFRDGNLQECRVRTFRDQKASVRGKHQIVPYVAELLDQCSPHALLVPKISSAGTRRRSPQVARTIRIIVREAVGRGIAVHVVGADAVRNAFRQPDGTPAKNRQQIHMAILKQFPELTLMVPEPRLKIWEPEQYFTPLFSTVAMYLAWQDKGDVRRNVA